MNIQLKNCLRIVVSKAARASLRVQYQVLGGCLLTHMYGIGFYLPDYHSGGWSVSDETRTCDRRECSRIAVAVPSSCCR